jgi:hypothetical protein
LPECATGDSVGAEKSNRMAAALRSEVRRTPAELDGRGDRWSR